MRREDQIEDVLAAGHFGRRRRGLRTIIALILAALLTSVVFYFAHIL